MIPIKLRMMAPSMRRGRVRYPYPVGLAPNRQAQPAARGVRRLVGQQRGPALPRGRARAGRPARPRPSVEPVSATSSICWAIRPAAVTPRFSAPPASLCDDLLEGLGVPVGDRLPDRLQRGRRVARRSCRSPGRGRPCCRGRGRAARRAAPGRGRRPGAGRRRRGRAGAQRTACAGALVAQPAREHRGQRARVDRLGQEVVHAGGQAALPLALDRGGGHRDHREPCAGVLAGRGSPGWRRTRPSAASARPSARRRTPPLRSTSSASDAVVGGRRRRSRAPRAGRRRPAG